MRKTIALILFNLFISAIFANPSTILTTQPSTNLSSYIKYSPDEEQINNNDSETIKSNIFHLFATSNSEKANTLIVTIKCGCFMLDNSDSMKKTSSFVYVLDKNKKPINETNIHTYEINHIINTGTILTDTEIDSFYLAWDNKNIDEENCQVTIQLNIKDQ